MAERPFAYSGGALHCGDVPLSEIAERFGTPAYVYSAAAIRRAYAAMDAAFASLPHRICYSVKANPNLAVCSLLAGLGAGADVTSGGELHRALRAGFPPESIVFAGVGKRREEMADALRAGIGLFSVESAGELCALSEVAAALGTVAPVALRVNPDVDPRTHPYITTGLARNKFGVPISEARALCARAAALPGIRVVGVGMHIGSQLTDLSPIAVAARSLAALARDLLDAGHPLRWFDVGGGYGIPYGDEPADSPARLAAELAELLHPLGLTLLTEPGRSLIGPAGALLLRVLYRKTNGDRAFLIADAGMNALLRPALYGARHRIVAVREGAGETDADLAGPICESSDLLSRDVPVPDVRPGELLAILDAGAYGFSMASEYNGHPRPAEVLVDGSTARLVRRRQTYDEMLAPEVEP